VSQGKCRPYPSDSAREIVILFRDALKSYISKPLITAKPLPPGEMNHIFGLCGESVTEIQAAGAEFGFRNVQT
jgi:hypothetical protein